MRPAAARIAVLTAAGLCAVPLAACSSSGGTDAAATFGAGAGAGAGGDAHTANVTITAAKGCELDRTQFAAGGITFKVRNSDATAVSEVELLSGQRIVGEKENLPPGLAGEFAVKVGAGSYTLYCPGAAIEKSTIRVTGKSGTGDVSVAALLKTATDNYSRYVSTQVGYLVGAVQKLDVALHGTDLAAAQDAYKQARPFYEKIEPVAESFTIGSDSLDADIDARENDVPASQWKGFHRIEKGLFADRSLAGLGPFGDGLVASVKKLQRLTAGLTYEPTELANGAQELMDEVAGGKITGEEERYSHIDLLDVANNDEGAEQAFAQLQPALEKIDPALSATIQTRFTALDKLVDTYRSTSDASGYVLYTTLTEADKRQLAAAVKAVQEPLSQVASKLANA
jgi:iron uptake system component EfeO